MEVKRLRGMIESAARLVTDRAWQSGYRQLLATPVNPDASPAARELLAELYELQGRALLTGQHNYLEAPDALTNTLSQLSGAYPAIKGVELGAISGQNGDLQYAQRRNTINSCIEWHKRGGIVTATYHAAYPGERFTWNLVQRPTTQEEFNRILTPGNPLHQALLTNLDDVAEWLGVLRDADVPVLWRPYHEMNGGWFWWGRKSNFTELWELMYDRFVHRHGLNNLLWVWCPNAKNEWCDEPAAYYPGSHRADILALDIYEGDYKQSHYDMLWDLGCGKIIAIGENGQLPDPERTLVNQPNWSYQMTWGNLLQEKNSADQIRRFMRAGTTFTLGDYQSHVHLTPPFLPSPPSPDTPAPEIQQGLRAQYFSGTQFDQLKMERVDERVAFDWAGGKPVPELPADSFSIRWTGLLIPRFTEEYTIEGCSDDGMRVRIGDQLVVDRWRNGSSCTSGKIRLEAGKRYPITVEYYEATGAAWISLSWMSPSQQKEVIPASCLRAL